MYLVLLLVYKAGGANVNWRNMIKSLSSSFISTCSVNLMHDRPPCPTSFGK